MSSRFSVKQRPASSRADPAAVPSAAVHSDTTVNDETPTSTFAIFGDPLWGMAIASGILFLVLAALIALA